MNGNLNVDTSTLNSVGNNFSTVASDVRGIFTEMIRIIEQVTSHESWTGEASRTFLEKFNGVKPTFEKHLQELEDLGPAVNQTATNYSDTEAENVGMMH